MIEADYKLNFKKMSRLDMKKIQKEINKEIKVKGFKIKCPGVYYSSEKPIDLVSSEDTEHDPHHIHTFTFYIREIYFDICYMKKKPTSISLYITPKTKLKDIATILIRDYSCYWIAEQFVSD